MENPPEKTLVRVYVDALNFYYGIAKKYQCKWIDIKGLFLELIQQKIPNAEIEKIYLFTAEVKWDAAALLRQREYLGALHELYGDSLEVVYGYMKEVHKTGKPIKDNAGLVTISTREEKETDVNLACQMVKDACFAAYKDNANEEFEIACLVSNDSDLEAPLKIRKGFRQRTLVIFPIHLGSRKPSASGLRKHVPKKDRIYNISESVLNKHRLPDKVGKWHCPELWVEEERKRAEEQARRA